MHKCVKTNRQSRCQAVAFDRDSIVEGMGAPCHIVVAEGDSQAEAWSQEGLAHTAAARTGPSHKAAAAGLDPFQS